MSASNFPPPAALLYTPSDCGDYARALIQALELLEQAGVRIPRAGRLRAAARLLLNASESPAFPLVEAERRRLANAMSDASDFVDIAELLPEDRSRQILGELQIAMKGTLDDARQRQPSYRFQSQYWLASILTRGGYRPRVPKTGGPQPDYLVNEGTFEYGFEIKRPEKAASAGELVADGAAQLKAYGVHGVILCDLTECIGVDELSYLTPGTEMDARNRVMDRFRALSYELGSVVLDEVNHRRRAGCENVLALVHIGRGWSWIAREPSGLALFAVSGATLFFSPVRNLRYHHSINLVERTIGGLRAAGYEFDQFREAAAPADRPPFSWSV